MYGVLSFHLSDRGQISMFWEVLANKAVGVFVQATFPLRIRMHEVDCRGEENELILDYVKCRHLLTTFLYRGYI